jgi:hypothetical protein
VKEEERPARKYPSSFVAALRLETIFHDILRTPIDDKQAMNIE